MSKTRKAKNNMNKSKDLSEKAGAKLYSGVAAAAAAIERVFADSSISAKEAMRNLTENFGKLPTAKQSAQNIANNSKSKN